jgi:hypothetical protein
MVKLFVDVLKQKSYMVVVLMAINSYRKLVLVHQIKKYFHSALHLTIFDLYLHLCAKIFRLNKRIIMYDFVIIQMDDQSFIVKKKVSLISHPLFLRIC